MFWRRFRILRGNWEPRDFVLLWDYIWAWHVIDLLLMELAYLYLVVAVVLWNGYNHDQSIVLFPSYLQMIFHPWPKNPLNLPDAPCQKCLRGTGELNDTDFSHVLTAKIQPVVTKQKLIRRKRQTSCSRIPIYRNARKRQDNNVLWIPPKKQGYVVRQPQEGRSSRHYNYSTMVSKPARARLLWVTISVFFPLRFDNATAYRSPALA